MTIRLIRAEFLKMREMMTLLALLAGPGLVGALSFLGGAVRRNEASWSDILPNMGSFWVVLLFPLSFVAFCAFAAQIEHRARAWDHLLMLPAPKWRIFTAKAVVMTAAAAAINVLFVAFLLLGGWLGGLLSPAGPFTGPLAFGDLAAGIAVAAAAGLFMVAVQTWLSLRYSHFIVPLLAGIGGVACSLAGLIFRQAQKTRFAPWATPNEVYMKLGAQSPDTQWMLAYGVAGGLIVFIVMAIHLSRREMRP